MKFFVRRREFTIFVFFLIFVLSQSWTKGDSVATLCTPSCFVKSEDGPHEISQNCGFQYYMSNECELDSSLDLRLIDSSTTTTSTSDVNHLRVETRPIDTANAAVDLSVTVNITGKVAVMLSGITDRKKRRCIIVCFDSPSQQLLTSVRHLQSPKWDLPGPGQQPSIATQHLSDLAQYQSDSDIHLSVSDQHLSGSAQPLSDPAQHLLGPDHQLLTLTATCVGLPNGLYNATILSYGGTGDLSATCGTPKGHYISSRGVGVTVLSHTRFPVPLSRSADVYPWDKKLHRNRRVGERSTLSMEDLLWGPDQGRAAPSCPCYHCLITQHMYDNTTALLKLSYEVNSTDECCANCSSLKLVLYQYVSVDDEKLCTELNFTTAVVNGLRLVMPDKNVTHGPVEYPNIGSGCYTFRLRPWINPSPVYHGFFWLKSRGNVTNMNNWNTTFYLKPHPDQGSLEVIWTSPPYPYNFSHYELQLWHHKNYSIRCRGEKLYHDEPITVIPESGKILLNSPGHHFRNLSRGWYCARVTPIDPRCPPDGCEPRSSRAKLLKAGTEPYDVQEIRNNIVPILIGVVAGVLLSGVVLACIVMRCQASRNFIRVAYTKVRSGGGVGGGAAAGGRFGEAQKVLLVWTAAGADGANLLPVIQAFKKLLMSYSKCEIYDYLELRSIPPDQREHLLATPTAWLDAILNQRSVRIIVVGSEGGRYRQVQWMSAGGKAMAVPHLQPQDNQLFPYLLQRLQDRPDLAADYSRVFHVRFNDISSEEAELEGVVSWTRYRLPQHLRALTLALHGMREDDGSWLEEPTSEDLQNVQRALTSHPLYRSQSGAKNNRTSNHSTALGAAKRYAITSGNAAENESLLNHASDENCIPAPHAKSQRDSTQNRIPLRTINSEPQTATEGSPSPERYGECKSHLQSSKENTRSSATNANSASVLDAGNDREKDTDNRDNKCLSTANGIIK